MMVNVVRLVMLERPFDGAKFELESEQRECVGV